MRYYIYLDKHNIVLLVGKSYNKKACLPYINSQYRNPTKLLTKPTSPVFKQHVVSNYLTEKVIDNR